MNKFLFREKFSVFVLISIGIIYLLLFIISLAGSSSNLLRADENNININTQELKNHSRTIIIILFTLFAGILLLRRKKTGWIMAVAVLPVFLIILGGGWYELIKMEIYDISAVLLAAGSLILLLAFLFLIMKTFRKKLSLKKSDYLMTAILFLILATFFFFL